MHRFVKVSTVPYAAALLVVFAWMLTPQTALAFSSSTTLAGDGSFAAMSDDRGTLFGCDGDKDSHKAYLRRYDVWGSLYPATYDPDGAGGACAAVPVNDWPLASYNICVQQEGCGTPVYRAQFQAPQPAPTTPSPPPPPSVSPDDDETTSPPPIADTAGGCARVHPTLSKAPALRVTIYVCRRMSKEMWRGLRAAGGGPEAVAKAACRYIKYLPFPWKLARPLCVRWVQHRVTNFKKHVKSAADTDRCFTWTMEQTLGAIPWIDHVGASGHGSYCTT